MQAAGYDRHRPSMQGRNSDLHLQCQMCIIGLMPNVNPIIISLVQCPPPVGQAVMGHSPSRLSSLGPRGYPCLLRDTPMLGAWTAPQRTLAEKDQHGVYDRLGGRMCPPLERSSQRRRYRLAAFIL